MSLFQISDIGRVLSFQTYAGSLLGIDFTRVKLTAILDYASVSDFEPAVRHAQVYPSLPVGSPDDFRSYLYVKLTLENGKPAVVGLPWIKASTIVWFNEGSVTVTLRNTPVSELSRLSAVLKSNNFTDFTIKTE